jgi:hypothetical protein
MAAEEISKIQERVNALLEKYKTTKEHAQRRELLLALRLAIAEIDSAELSRDGKSPSN